MIKKTTMAKTTTFVDIAQKFHVLQKCKLNTLCGLFLAFRDNTQILQKWIILAHNVAVE